MQRINTHMFMEQWTAYSVGVSGDMLPLNFIAERDASVVIGHRCEKPLTLRGGQIVLEVVMNLPVCKECYEWS